MATEPCASARRVFWVAGNGSSHRGLAAARRLQCVWPTPRLVHLPIHASWRTQVEVCFPVIQRKILTPNDFGSLAEAEAALLAFQDYYQQIATPFEWKFTKSGLDLLLKRLATHEPAPALAAWRPITAGATGSAAGRGAVRVTGVMVQTVGVEFFCYHRDRPGSVTLREELLEEHRSYMDRYGAGMIARGPTLANDDDTPTGSVHIVGLPDPAAARAFAFDEPGYQAGVYRDVLLRRWRNLLGRTMWDFPGGADGGNRYLVLGFGSGSAVGLAVPPGQDELIAYGPLLSDNGATWLGTAVLIRARDPDAARAILTPDRYAGTEVHRWQFGGRPS
jgi:uncharacterized protein